MNQDTLWMALPTSLVLGWKQYSCRERERERTTMQTVKRRDSITKQHYWTNSSKITSKCFSPLESLVLNFKSKQFSEAWLARIRYQRRRLLSVPENWSKTNVLEIRSKPDANPFPKWSLIELPRYRRPSFRRIIIGDARLNFPITIGCSSVLKIRSMVRPISRMIWTLPKSSRPRSLAFSTCAAVMFPFIRLHVLASRPRDG